MTLKEVHLAAESHCSASCIYIIMAPTESREACRDGIILIEVYYDVHMLEGHCTLCTGSSQGISSSLSQCFVIKGIADLGILKW